ncbi:hypothetical protein [Altericroceibacterium xinjiangense]|uniref:hypothetical protein n=1 Tax=Altericroceibacterium xinjiangense TaxID=762261 RepID=UPI000F7F098D|nr:hypothetical protein [Altericroceibacterium xinjiangense]
MAFNMWRNRNTGRWLDQYPTDANGNPIISPSPEPELQREVDLLRERIEVLERIITEDREAKRLSAEIESLRVSPDEGA